VIRPNDKIGSATMTKARTFMVEFGIAGRMSFNL
jgi:hypothetical protein